MYDLPAPESIRSIIFDFGGVLFDIDYDLPVHAFRELGYADFDAIYTQSAQTELFDRLETGKAGREEFIETVRPFLPKGVTDDQILHAWNVILLGIPKERVELVYRLKEKYRTFILSNTNALHVKEFEQMIDESIGLEWFKGAFEKVYYSNEIGMKKPYPETFQKICAWNNLDPKETLFIDDSKQHVEGALKAGLQAYHLDLSKEDVLHMFRNWV